MNNVQIIDHPLVQHSLTVLRKKQTGTAEFRRHARLVSQIVVLEAVRGLPLAAKEIETPLAPMTGQELREDVVVVPVLRAGLAMLFAVQEMLPFAGVGFVGLERDEETAQAREYYKKLPQLISSSRVIVLDPMLATGGSFDDTARVIKEKGGRDISLACIVAAPEGIERIAAAHPGVRIYTAAIDSHLNERKYIVPGLGDFGDRYFGTV